jgi:hypothetical protein
MLAMIVLSQGRRSSLPLGHLSEKDGQTSRNTSARKKMRIDSPVAITKSLFTTMASLRPSSTSLGILLLASVSISLVKSSQAAPFALPHPRVAFLPYVALDVRGGSTQQLQDQDDDDTENNEEEDPEVIKKREALRKYRMEQQMLMQLRSTFLSEALAKRGLPMTTLLDVSTAEGDQPPEKVDWDCAISTEDDPKVTCHLSPRKNFHSFLKLPHVLCPTDMPLFL